MDFQKLFHPKVVAFDFDGTLVDTMNGYADVAARIIHERYGVSFDQARDGYLETSGIPFYFQLEELFEGDERNEKAARRFEGDKLDVLWATNPDPRLFDTFEALNKEGIHTVISSNNHQENVSEYVQKHSIQVSQTLGYSLGFMKGRDHFDHICTHFGVETHEILFVGDSLSDAVKANECGVRFIAREGTFTKKDFYDTLTSSPIIRELDELLVLLGIRVLTQS